jgi:hypothetical protein
MSRDDVERVLEEAREVADWRRRMNAANSLEREWARRFLGGATLSPNPTIYERAGKILSLLAPRGSHHFDDQED